MKEAPRSSDPSSLTMRARHTANPRCQPYDLCCAGGRVLVFQKKVHRGLRSLCSFAITSDCLFGSAIIRYINAKHGFATCFDRAAADLLGARMPRPRCTPRCRPSCTATSRPPTCCSATPTCRGRWPRRSAVDPTTAIHAAREGRQGNEPTRLRRIHA